MSSENEPQAQAQQPTEPPRMSDEELKRFVLDFCDGRIFSSGHIAESDLSLLPSIFMVLIFMEFSEAYYDHVGLIWERLSEAAPTSINGYPCFFSCHVMHKLDWERVRKVISAERERRSALTL